MVSLSIVYPVGGMSFDCSIVPVIFDREQNPKNHGKVVYEIHLNCPAGTPLPLFFKTKFRKVTTANGRDNWRSKDAFVVINLAIRARDAVNSFLNTLEM